MIYKKKVLTLPYFPLIPRSCGGKTEESHEQPQHTRNLIQEFSEYQCFSFGWNYIDIFIVVYPAVSENLYTISFGKTQNGSGAHPASYPMGTRDSSLGVKRPGREADH
jgi:hypothetical protein